MSNDIAIKGLKQELSALQARVDAQELTIEILQQQRREIDELLLTVHVLVEKKASGLLDELTRYRPSELALRCMDMLSNPSRT